MVSFRAQYTAAMAALTAARTEQMLDTGTATRPAAVGQTPVLDADGNVVAGTAPTVWTGPCTISDPASGRGVAVVVTTDDEAGVPNARVLKVPHDADLRPGDLFTVTTAACSPFLAGDTFVVIGEEERSFATCRRYRLRGSSWASPASGG